MHILRVMKEMGYIGANIDVSTTTIVHCTIRNMYEGKVLQAHTPAL